MGEFLSISSVRGRPAREIAEALTGYAAEYGVSTASGKQAADVVDFIEVPGTTWTVVGWPRAFTGHNPVACRLSGTLTTIVSSIDVYDGDFWRHVLCEKGHVVDRFTSDRGYFGPDDDPGEAWNGSATAIAAALGLTPGLVAPYLVQPARQHGRARPDDESALDSPWVFVDFWRRLGIRYPDPSDPVALTLSFDAPLDEVFPSERADF